MNRQNYEPRGGTHVKTTHVSQTAFTDPAINAERIFPFDGYWLLLSAYSPHAGKPCEFAIPRRLIFFKFLMDA